MQQRLCDRARADRRLAVGSALFGLVRGDDAIPAYRLSAGSALLGPISEPFGFTGLFFAAAGCAGVALVALRLLDQEAHRTRMDTLDAAPAAPMGAVPTVVT